MGAADRPPGSALADFDRRLGANDGPGPPNAANGATVSPIGDGASSVGAGAKAVERHSAHRPRWAWNAAVALALPRGSPDTRAAPSASTAPRSRAALAQRARPSLGPISAAPSPSYSQSL